MKITQKIEVTIDIHSKKYCGHKCQFWVEVELMPHCSLFDNVELMLEEIKTKSKTKSIWEYQRTDECVKMFKGHKDDSQ